MKLHVYQQVNNHGDAWLVGDKEALTSLRNKIDEALRQDQPQAFVAFAQDGEGFTAFVMPLEKTDEKWEALTSSYVDPFYKSCAVDDIEEGLHPSSLLDCEKYRELHKQASKEEEDSYQKGIL